VIGTRVAVHAWTQRLVGVVAELAAARLRWCVVCGRVGLWGWQPLCAAMPITWICGDRAGCRTRQALERLPREHQGCWSVLWGRPGLTRPPTGRPWHLAGLAGPDCTLHGEVVRALANDPEQPAGDPTAEMVVLARSWPDAAAAGRVGERR
jgi:hypothetical protein